MRYKIINKTCIFILLSYAFGVNADELIRAIHIEGNTRIEKSTILNYLNLHSGDRYNSVIENEALKHLYATTLFENISLKFANGNLIVHVKENSFVNKVNFKGNSKISTSIIDKELQLKAGDSYNSAKVKHDVNKILELYKRKGRYSSTVDPRIEYMENNRVNITYQITEGPKTAIKNITFIGNENYRSNELKSIILTKESAWWRFLSSDDAFDPDRMEYDKIMLTNFYRSVGFTDFRVISASAELSPAKDYFTVTYSIEEGDKYNFGNIDIQNSIVEIDNKLLEKYITIKSGDLYNANLLEKIADQISYELATHGYPQIEIFPSETKNYNNKTVNITFIVREAKKVYLNNINIYGNVKTRENVIRREFKIEEGDLYNQAQVDRSEQRLRNLDYFETVNLSLKPTNDTDKYDIDVEVADKSTSQIGLSVGYNNSSGLFTSIDFNERNLIGTGKSLDIGVRRTGSNTNFNIGLADPYFMDRDFLVGLDGFISFTNKNRSKSSKDEQPYDMTTIGGGPRVAYDITEYLRHDIDLVVKHDKVRGISPSSSFAIQEQSGTSVTSALGQTFTYDKADSRIIPKNGYLLSYSQEIAGLGGDTKYFKNEVGAKYFVSTFNNQVTFKIKGDVGNIKGYGGKVVKIQDRFSVGDYNLRGFEMGGIGPRDKRTGESIRGQNYYTGTAEVAFPLGLPKELDVNGVLFVDVGSLWGFDISKNNKYKFNLYSKDDIYNSKSMRVSYGAGLVWVTRFAPIEIYYAIPRIKKQYDKTQRLHFRVAARL